MLEDQFHKTAFIEDELERERAVQELAKHSDEALKTAIQILESSQNSLKDVAIQVIVAIGYPENASAIPVLIKIANNQHAASQKIAFEALWNIGAWTVVPFILQARAQDDTLDDLAFELLSAEGIWLSTLNDAETKQVIHDLLAHAEKHLDVSLYILQEALKEWWEIAMQIIQATGYPRNASAIPIVIMHASDWNSVAQQIALQILRSMEPVTVAQYFTEILLIKDRKVGKWAYNIEAIYHLLLDMGKQYCIPCGPTISFLIAHDNGASKSNIQQLLAILEKIGPNDAAYTLPTLIDLIMKTKANEVRMKAWQFILSFDVGSLEPYKLILDSISDNSREQAE